MTFEELLAQGGGTCFLTGKREYTIQAMMASWEISFHNELEAADYTVTNDGETYTLISLQSRSRIRLCHVHSAECFVSPFLSMLSGECRIV